jgi:selenocysteine lyase/cysteine desulfurase
VSPDSEDYANLLDYDLAHFDNARRFEVMSMPVQDLIAMAESVALLLELGLPAIERHVRTLIDRIVSGVLDRSDLELITPADASKRSGIVAIAPPSPQAVSARLQARGVRHSLRQGAIRFAPYFYNTEEEMDAALAILCDTLA